jgi:phenylpyruvate tautomerase PptA (4-oxalocrotonate tautomerase family)
VTNIAKILDKSEDFIMVIFQQTNFQSFGLNTIKPSIYIELKNVGDLSADITNFLSRTISELFVEVINLDPTRLYIEFQSSKRHQWGWNRKTFHTPE